MSCFAQFAPAVAEPTGARALYTALTTCLTSCISKTCFWYRACPNLAALCKDNADCAAQLACVDGCHNDQPTALPGHCEANVCEASHPIFLALASCAESSCGTGTGGRRPAVVRPLGNRSNSAVPFPGSCQNKNSIRLADAGTNFIDCAFPVASETVSLADMKNLVGDDVRAMMPHGHCTGGIAVVTFPFLQTLTLTSTAHLFNCRVSSGQLGIQVTDVQFVPFPAGVGPIRLGAVRETQNPADRTCHADVSSPLAAEGTPAD